VGEAALARLGRALGERQELEHRSSSVVARRSRRRSVEMVPDAPFASDRMI
jgi:hypothetical protein